MKDKIAIEVTAMCIVLFIAFASSVGYVIFNQCKTGGYTDGMGIERCSNG